MLLTTATLRRHLRQITARFYADLPVLSYSSELGPDTQVDVIDTIFLETENENSPVPDEGIQA